MTTELMVQPQGPSRPTDSWPKGPEGYEDHVNLTPYPITVLSGDWTDSEGWTDRVIEPSGTVVEIEEYYDKFHGLLEFRNVLNVPMADGVHTFIVPMPALILRIGMLRFRNDVVTPHPVVLDTSGRVIGCRGFVRVMLGLNFREGG